MHILRTCKERKLRKAGLTEVENIAKILLRHDLRPIKDGRFAGSQMLHQLRDYWQHCHGLPLIIRLTLPFLVFVLILEKNIWPHIDTFGPDLRTVVYCCHSLLSTPFLQYLGLKES